MKMHRRGGRGGALFRDQKGATGVEYGLILALIFLALISGVTSLGGAVKDRWNAISDAAAGTGS